MEPRFSINHFATHKEKFYNNGSGWIAWLPPTSFLDRISETHTLNLAKNKKNDSVLLEPCEKVLLRVEKDVVTSNENCYQKDAELCGPRNCKVIEKIAKTIRDTFCTNHSIQIHILCTTATTRLKLKVQCNCKFYPFI